MKLTRAAALIALVAAAVPCSASFLADDLFVPGIARGEGSQGSRWYTTLWLHNPSPGVAQASISLLLRDQANPTPDQQLVTLQSGATLVFRDAVLELFGLQTAAGALRVQCNQRIVAGTRVYNQPGDDLAETQGQLMAGIPASFAVGNGQSADIPAVMQPADGTFRTNFGLVETVGAAATVDVTLVDAAGTTLGAQRFDLQPRMSVQRSLASLAYGTTFETGRLHVAVSSGTGAVIAYGSLVANGTTSQDPTTLEMNLDADRIFAQPSTAITSVVAGPGLAGGGSEGDVTLEVLAGDGIAVSEQGVAIRPAGITSDHIAAGEVLLGAKVGERILHDVVTLEAGPNVTIAADQNTITISAAGACDDHLEQPITAAISAYPPGSWIAGTDELEIPTAGRWRVGYRVAVTIRNAGVASTSDPVNVALADLTDDAIVRGSISVVGLRLDIAESQLLTVSGEAVVDVDRPTTFSLICRVPTLGLAVTVHPHDADLDTRLSAPDASSFLYADCIRTP